MIVSHLRKLIKLTILIAVRQVIYLLRNWYLLLTQPFSVVKEILEKQDKSQMFLIGVSAFLPVFIYVISRIAWDLVNYGRVIWITGRVFSLTIFFQSLILGYLSYWVFKVFTSRK